MVISHIRTSGFSLAKRQELKGDDYYDVKTIDNLTIAIVCDGVGSAQEGAQAAKRVTTHLVTNFKSKPISWSIEKSIQFFIKSINSILYQESIVNYERPELVTTLAVVVIQGNRLYGANIGDSRIYLLRDGKLNKLSCDHSMDEDGYENVLTQAIGIAQSVEPYYFENTIYKDDKLLLCSDGLYNILDEKDLKKDLFLGANLLVKKASKIKNDNLPDDTTAITIEILKENEVEILKALNLYIPINLNINDVIDGYILKKSLIQNNRTWLCSKNSKQYVLKFPPIEAIDDKNILDLFVKEAWNSKRLKAGFFPKAVIPKKRTARYYVMQAIDGINLKTFLTKRKLHIEDAISLTKTILNMGQYLVKYDLVHGDIKPENIMIIKRDGKYVFKIIDFSNLTEMYSINSVAGTPSYLAPERFKGASINEQTEIFSIGVTLYEVLTQKFPYGEIEPFQNPDFKNPKLPKTLNNNIPLWLETIILRSISIEPELRYNNYSEVIYELENSNKVKPFYRNDIPLLERNPLRTYQILFYLMLIINIIILANKFQP